MISDNNDKAPKLNLLKPHERNVGKFDFKGYSGANEFDVISTARNPRDLKRLARYRGRYIQARDSNNNVVATYYPYTNEFTFSEEAKTKHSKQWQNDFEAQFMGNTDDYLK